MYDALDPLNIVDISNAINRGHPFAQGLIGFWKLLPGIEGGKKLYDLMGRNDGTLTNATYGQSAGVLECGGRHIAVNGSTGYVDCGNPPNNTFDSGLTTGLTIFADFRIGNTTSFPGIVGKGNSDSNTSGSYLVFCSSFSSSTCKLGFVIWSSSARNVSLTTSNRVITADGQTWNRIAATWKANTSSGSALYVNGLVATTTGANSSLANPDSSSFNLLFGTNEGNGSNKTAYPLNGAFNNIRIYSRDFSAAQIWDIYAHAQMGFPGLLNYVRPMGIHSTLRRNIWLALHEYDGVGRLYRGL